MAAVRLRDRERVPQIGVVGGVRVWPPIRRFEIAHCVLSFNTAKIYLKLLLLPLLAQLVVTKINFLATLTANW
jgi:hypothetical protein